MSLTDRLQRLAKIDQKFAWSTFGACVGIIGLYLYFYPLNREIEIDIQSQNNVFDLHNPIDDLKVVFRGADIRELRQNLKVFNLTIANRGWGDFKQDDFDENERWGIEIEQAEIVKLTFSSSDEYLARHIEKSEMRGSSIIFPRIMFDKGKSFNVTVLLLHKDATDPRIRFVGKISGLGTVPVRESWREDDRKNLLRISFFGTWRVQLLRLATYASVGLLFAMLIIALITNIESKVSSIKRNRRERAIAKIAPTYSAVSGFEIINDRYVSDGKTGLLQLREIVSNQELLTKIATKIEEANSNEQKLAAYSLYSEFGERVRIVFGLKRRGILTKDSKGNSWHADASFRQTLDEVLGIVK